MGLERAAHRLSVVRNRLSVSQVSPRRHGIIIANGIIKKELLSRVDCIEIYYDAIGIVADAFNVAKARFPGTPPKRTSGLKLEK